MLKVHKKLKIGAGEMAYQVRAFATFLFIIKIIMVFFFRQNFSI